MKETKANFWQLLGLALVGYVLLILGHGYVFGHLGMIETLPYLKSMEDSSLYPNDFYIQGIKSRFPDVRWMFVKLLLALGLKSAWGIFLAHFVVTIGLLLGMLRVAFYFLKNNIFSFLAVMLAVLVLYNHNLGGNELYYNSLSPSLIAKAMSIWAMYYFLNHRFSLAIFILIPATFIHPMVGVQLFLLFLGDSLWRVFKGVSLRKIPIVATISYLLTSGVWIGYLQRSFSDSTIPTTKVFEILKYRLGHHYFPSVYPLVDYVLLIPFIVLGWMFFFRKNKSVFLFYSLAILGLVIYVVGVEFLEVGSILSAQWFKTTIWLKFFSSIALFGIIQKFILAKAEKLQIYLVPLTAILFIGLGVFLWMKLPQRHPLTLDLPWRGDYNDRIKIALLAKAKTPKGALFLTPTDFTHLKYFGERSTYVDYKATIHFRPKLVGWYERIGAVYTNENAPSDSHQRLEGRLKMKSLEELKKLGITYLISKKTLNAKLIAQAGDYLIYELK